MRSLLFAAACCALSLANAAGQAPSHDTTLVSFDDAAAWQAIPSDGVRLALHSMAAPSGAALRFDYDFQGHAGYGIARRAFTLPPLPPHWAMTLKVRGEGRPNTIEIKLVDSSGLNVWWMRRVAFPPPASWTELRFRPTDLSFAWGPLGGGAPRGIAAMEIAVTAAAGGAGWIALDDLVLIPLPPPVALDLRPSVTASSALAGRLEGVIPSDFHVAPVHRPSPRSANGWRTTAGGEQALTLDFHGPRELSGLVLDWDATMFARRYDVQRSDDGRQWTTVASIRDARGGRRFVHLPELETRWLRLALHESGAATYALDALHVLPITAAPTRSAFLETIASASPPGDWPRPLTRQQSYYTVVGLPRDERDAIVSEDGNVEPHPGSFSVEPFLRVNGSLLTWKDGRTSHALDGGWRPIPIVRRTSPEVALETTTFAAGAALWSRYRVINRTSSRLATTLALAVRPVQVNPPWQFLGTAGGAADVRTLRWDGRALVVNDSDRVFAVTPGAHAGHSRFDAGSIVEWLHGDRLPNVTDVRDSTGLASGAMTWRVTLAPHDSTDVWVAITGGASLRDTQGATALNDARRIWDKELGGVRVEFPLEGSDVARTLRTALSDILINARGPAIQPGTRSYRRSWIRDGALTSAALLKLGHAADVRAFLEWFLPFQFADGKVPCCVDARGADPVPENDSDGELLYLAAEYLRMTGDSATIVRSWPALANAARHLDSLRNSRRTATYQTADSAFVFGLLPPSISHEGYSSKPAYSYWDDWWGVRGMIDAAFLARVAHDSARAATLAVSAREFSSEVVRSVRAAMALHHMHVLPGAAELGDFDPTSSTIALEPAPGLSLLPPEAVRASFDSAWVNFVHRRDGGTWDVYTPYEWRMVGSYVRLGQPERAHALAQWYMATRRPAEWNEWSEAIWRDARAPKFIGDMPHGWVESDFIRSTLDLVEYERERDSVLIVGAGIPLRWARARGGVVVEGIHTWWGTLGLTARAGANTARLEVSGVRPPGGIEVRAPFGASPRAVRVDGRAASLTPDRHAVLLRAPVRSSTLVEFSW